jgi:hypothetical protein
MSQGRALPATRQLFSHVAAWARFSQAVDELCGSRCELLNPTRELNYQ